MCREIKKKLKPEVKDALLDPESANMYTDSDSSDDGTGDRKKAKKLRRGVTIINRRPPGVQGDGDSEIDENNSDQDDDGKSAKL